MAWLRLDDGFTKHPKFEGWKPAERWAWLEVMEYCARYRTRGRIPTDESLLPRSVTRQLLEKAERSGWCERRPESGSPSGSPEPLWINDFDLYNPPELDADELMERVKQAVEEHPGASANELARLIGGRRKAALEAIRRFRTGSDPVPQGGSGNHAGTGSARASRPVPSRSTEEEPPAAAPDHHAAAAAAELRERLHELGITLDFDPADTDRIHAWINLALDEAETNPAGYVITGVRTGAWPTPRTTTPEPIDHTARARELYQRTHDPEAVADWLAGIHSLSTSERERILHEVAA